MDKDLFGFRRSLKPIWYYGLLLLNDEQRNQGCLRTVPGVSRTFRTVQDLKIVEKLTN